MKCLEVREVLPELATGLSSGALEKAKELTQHVDGCRNCAAELAELRQTMAILDEWQSPEPSAYFDTRLMACWREEQAQTLAASQSSWIKLNWLRRPVMGLALATVLVAGAGVYNGWLRVADAPVANSPVAMQRGSAVSDLQALDENPDMYSDFDVLDELQPQDAAQTR